MRPNDKQLSIILEHLFKQAEQRQVVEAMLKEGISGYEAEKRFGRPENTAARHFKKYQAHIEYLKSLGLKV
ncbi:TPA: hypothetical protein NVH30_002960 [Vibrio cholerae]|nr:hypothetical protein [Vibrio cholerae]HCJ7273322.1 hypothetical protein [Vibrio cholerae]HCJ7280609.1 hypothetical protein [Vibrio cholerae]HCJ7318263.1 hypothetical protein [Vibrio cholerae]